jgi:hypothetical protein
VSEVGLIDRLLNRIFMLHCQSTKIENMAQTPELLKAMKEMVER